MLYLLSTNHKPEIETKGLLEYNWIADFLARNISLIIAHRYSQKHPDRSFQNHFMNSADDII